MVVVRTSSMTVDLGALPRRLNPRPAMTRASNRRSWAARHAPDAAGEALRDREQKEAIPMSGFEDIREHMEVIGADGAHIGTVDRVEDNRIKLIRADSGIGHEEHHHYIPKGLVAEVEGDRVRLTARGDVVADLFEQEESGRPLDEAKQ